MEEADKDWMVIKMVGGWVFLLVPAHPGSPGQRAVKRLLLLHLHVWAMCYTGRWPSVGPCQAWILRLLLARSQ